MPPLANLVGFAIAAIVLVAIPGPSVIFTISRALTMGRRTALLNVLGNAAGCSLQVVAVAIGIGELVEGSLVALAVIKYVGAAYIVFLGIQAIRHRGAILEALEQRVAPVSTRRALRDGLVVGATNPKTIVLFVAVLPGFAVPTEGHVPLQLLMLGAIFPLIAVVMDSGWALGAGALRHWLARSPKRLAAVGGTGGLMMIGLGAGLAVSGRSD